MFKSYKWWAILSSHQYTLRVPFLFVIHKRTFQLSFPSRPWEPPSRDTFSSIVMIVTLSLPFQLDAQFHLCVPQESQQHHFRLESPHCHPAQTERCSLFQHLLSRRFQHDRETCDRAGDNDKIDIARKHICWVVQKNDGLKAFTALVRF